MSGAVPVLVVGGGPVGMLNALGLARAGVPVTVFERSGHVVASPRAMVYHWSVLDGLERLGIYEQAVARGFLKQDYTYRIHKTGETIRYGLASLEGVVRHPHNLHLGQHKLVEVALAELARLPSAQVLWDHRFVALDQDGSSVVATFATPGGERTYRGAG